MKNLAESAATLIDRLGLTTSPVVVVFLRPGEEPEGFAEPKAIRFCQALMLARRGQQVLLTPDNIACPAAAAVLGFKPLPEKLESGEMLVGYGIFGNAVAGQCTVCSMPRLPRGEYAAVALSPLAETPFEPDVVIVEGLPEQIMWLALAERFEEGGRLEFSTAVLQATCVDGAVLPFVEQRINASFGCYGCRDATDFGPEEGVIGFPGYDLERIVAALEQLAAKAMPRVRAKTAYRAFQKRGELEKSNP